MHKMTAEYKRAFLLGYAQCQSQVAVGLEEMTRMVEEGLGVLPRDPMFQALDQWQSAVRDAWNTLRVKTGYTSEVEKTQEWLTQMAEAIHAESN